MFTLVNRGLKNMIEIIGLKEVSWSGLDRFDCPHCEAIVKVDEDNGLGWCPECRNLLAFQCPYDCFWFAFAFRNLSLKRLNTEGGG